MPELIECLVKAKHGEREQSEAEGEHGRHFWPQDVHTDTFQICAPQDNQKVSQGTCVRQVLQPLRHSADGESKARERDRRHDEEE